MQNPLFPSAAPPGQDGAYQPTPVYPPAPASHAPETPSNDPAVEMIRQKIQALYVDEPDAKEEMAEAATVSYPGSPHQAYMRELSNSGKSLVEIQTAWHAYYMALSDYDKYQVWQEFYVQSGANPAFQQAPAPSPVAAATPAPQQQVTIPQIPIVTPQSQQPVIVAPSQAQPAAPTPTPPIAQPVAAQPAPTAQPAIVAQPPVNAEPAAAVQPPQPVASRAPQLPLMMPAPTMPASQPATQPAAQQPMVIQSAQTPPVLPSSAELRGRGKKRRAASIERTADKIRRTLAADSPADIKKRILKSVKSAEKSDAAGGTKRKRPQLKAKHHLQSLAFGLSMGAVVVTIFLFSFFNEFVIAPLIQPSRKANDTPVIVDVASATVSGGPKVLIPKINVEIPVDYSQTTTDEKQIELALDKGVVHYPTTVRPGQTGNAAFFGHSSNNIFNPGKYKFAFVMLHELMEGDVFYLTNDGKTYAYKVFSKRIVQPTEVSVLGPVAGHASTATLITCDPPGTSINRLVVVGDQISPDANGNSVPTEAPKVETASAEAKTDLPGNGPTLWSRIWASIF